MENDHSKRINYGGNLVQNNKRKYSSSRTKREHISQLKPLTVKELLLEKLKQYKKEKSRKNRGSLHSTPAVFDNSVTQPLTTNGVNNAKHLKRQSVPTPSMNHSYGQSQQPEYGNLKNGIKPTYRQFRNNKTMRTEKKIPRLKIEVEKKFNLGRNRTQKNVGVFIKGTKLRREINNEKVDIQKSNIKTVKNYLKTQNLIKYGSRAPIELLREIYSSSKLCGDVFNVNGQSLVHNYLNDDVL